MRSIYRVALMVVTFAFILPLSARAEIKQGSTELGVFGGYNFFQNTQNLRNRPVFGGRIGYNFTRHFGVEGTVESITTYVVDKTRTGSIRGQFRSPVDGVSMIFYHLDAVYHFMPSSRFNPFILAGIGGADYNPTMSTNNMFALNLGAGMKYWFTEHVALRVDLRDYMVCEAFRWMYHNIGATVGVTVALGGHSYVAQDNKEVEPEPKVEKEVVVFVAEPKADEQLNALAAEPEEKVVVLAFEDIHFAFDKSELTPEAKTILKRNIQTLKKNPKAKIRIAGFTSASGTEDYNQKLSERRAQAVKDYLVQEKVVKPNRLSEIGYGKARPAMYESYKPGTNVAHTKAATANRRVLFEIIVE
ncbi:MAG: OmpA family protein [bacterium]